MKQPKAHTEEYNKLTQAEKKIYDAIMRDFPATSHDSAYDKAITGGCDFQFIPQ